MKKSINSKNDLLQGEEKVLDFWQKEKILNKYLTKNNQSEDRFSFIDGPITANNKMGVHHGWGRSIKDVVQRYYNMKGYRQRFQNGFDGQGLWVEVNVEKDLGLNSKKEIEEYGIDKFSKKCRSRVEKYSQIISQQSQRLGQFMDWSNSYQTMSDKNIEHIWHFLKICQQKKMLYLGERVLPWCRRCGTSLSSHELHDNYQELTHQAVYFKLKLKESNEHLLVWTTTPWTLLANVAVALDPELTYAKIKTDKEEVLILAEERLDVIEQKYEVIEKIKGSDLVGRKYLGLFDQFEAASKDHQIISWQEVSADEGTGLVHIAPGCGSEDFQLAKENNLKIVSPIDEEGNYLEGFGKYSGKSVDDVAEEIFEDLDSMGSLYKTEEYDHRYPLCWRCDQELVYRVVKEWFIEADPVRKQMKEEAAKTNWLPESSGKRMQNWLDNMSDWNISRKRYWGLPLPFYQCQKCDTTTVVGDIDELRRLAVDKGEVDSLPELHRPWIDKVKIKCPNCKSEVKRVEEVGDCWLDAGIVPYSTLNYKQDKKYWREWFPADFITEMNEQVRLWFYSMLFMSVVLEAKTPYKEVLTYSPVNDEKGEEMHKSKGNAIWFDEAVDRIGADVMRWLYLAQNPAYPLRFGFNRAKEINGKFNTWYNSLYFLVTYAGIDNWQPDNIKVEPENVLDRWLLSRLKEFLAEVDKMYLKRKFDKVIYQFDIFLDDLSNWYIRRSRRRFWDDDNKQDKESAYQTLYLALLKSAQAMAPSFPFFSERVYQILKEEKQSQSVHLTDFPTLEFSKDQQLIKDMAKLRQVVEKALSIRAKRGIKVRQPLAKLTIDQSFSNELVEIIKDEVNVKEVEVGAEEFNLDTKIGPKLKKEGVARELIRQIQSLRKKADYDYDDRIELYYITDSDFLKEVINDFGKQIAKEVLAPKGLVSKKREDVDISSDCQIDDYKIWLGLSKKR